MGGSHADAGVYQSKRIQSYISDAGVRGMITGKCSRNASTFYKEVFGKKQWGNPTGTRGKVLAGVPISV